MHVSFILTIDEESVDSQSLLQHADDIEAALDAANFDVVDVKPWARPSAGLPAQTQQQTTGLPPVSGSLI